MRATQHRILESLRRKVSLDANETRLTAAGTSMTPGGISSPPGRARHSQGGGTTCLLEPTGRKSARWCQSVGSSVALDAWAR